MDFAFSDEQTMLRDQARSWLAERLGAERVAQLADSDQGWDQESWLQMAELGWTGLSISEDCGGAGMSFLEEAVLFEELGYALYPGPYLSTVALALPALTGAPDVLAGVATGEASATLAWAEPGGTGRLRDATDPSTRAARSGDQWVLRGEKELVPDAALVDYAVVPAREDAGAALFLVDLSQARVGSRSTMDRTRRYGVITLDDTPARRLALEAPVAEIIERIRRRALASLALEAVGVAQKVLELARDYAGERKQFDRPIGVYQAVSHKVADTYMDVELSRSLAYWAAWCVAEDEQAALASATAKAFAGEAAVRACERSIQVHGGLGFSWEHVLHRYYKRAQWIESFEGPTSDQRAGVAEAILAG